MCPKEDSGGARGWRELRRVLATRGAGTVEREARAKWAADLLDPAGRLDVHRFDQDETAARLAWMVDEIGRVQPSRPYGAPGCGIGAMLGRLSPWSVRALEPKVASLALGTAPEISADDAAATTHPYRRLVEMIGSEGVDLTRAGYLPPKLAADLADEIGISRPWGRHTESESSTPGLVALRSRARKIGLVRVYRRRLIATKAGIALTQDPVALWWRVAAGVSKGLGAFAEFGLLLSIELAHGGHTQVAAYNRAVREMAHAMGYRDMNAEYDQLTVPVSGRALAPAWNEFFRLGLIQPAPGSDGTDFGDLPLLGGPEELAPPTPAAIAFARAALLPIPPTPPY
jgi:hypothetical protein